MCKVGFVLYENNPADAFTRLAKYPPLHCILVEKLVDIPLEQSVYRVENDSRGLKTRKC